MKVVSLKDYMKNKGKRPLLVRFISAPYFIPETAQEPQTMIIQEKVEDDAARLIGEVIDKGGIGRVFEDGVYRFLPWPCAVIEVKDLSSE